MRRVALLLFLCGSVSAQTFVDGDSIHDTDGNATVPALTTSSGDVTVAMCTHNAADVYTTAPADMTQLDEQTFATGNTQRWAVWARVDDATPDALTFGHSGTCDDISCAAIAYSGVHADIYDVTYAFATHYVGGSANVLDLDPAAITTATNGAEVCVLEGVSEGLSGAYGASSGYTARASIGGSAEANNGGVFIFCKNVATAGAEDPGSTGHTDDGVGADPETWGITIAFKPAGSQALPPLTVNQARRRKL